MVYEGYWKEGKKSGSGTLFLPNGDCFSGEWMEGVLDGPVSYKFAERSPWNDPEY